MQKISIHALREEGDLDSLRTEVDTKLFLSTPSARRATQRAAAEKAAQEISIHALREEGDLPYKKFPAKLSAFLSTPSARRATWHQKRRQSNQKHFYPRPPRGGRLGHKF